MWHVKTFKNSQTPLRQGVVSTNERLLQVFLLFQVYTHLSSGISENLKSLASNKGGGKEPSGIVAGDRPDNKWLQYDSSSLPRTQQDWDRCVFVEKTHWGYYCWPRLL